MAQKRRMRIKPGRIPSHWILKGFVSIVLYMVVSNFVCLMIESPGHSNRLHLNPFMVNSQHNQADQRSDSNDDDDDDEIADANEKRDLEQEHAFPRAREELWVGGAYPMTLKVSVVISHCKENLSWLREYLSDIPLRNIIIVSKCGVVPDDENLPDGTQLLQLPNVGRCDHTVAYWITDMVHSYDEDEIIVFLKDNLDIHQEAKRRGILEMMSVAFLNGFACSLKPTGGYSNFHDTAMLAHFNMTSYDGVPKYTKDGNLILNSNNLFKSRYENMGAWLDRMAISLPNPYTPVCYGGIFAVKNSRIAAVPMHVRQNLKQSLERGDNIEEGHFAERTWAGLLSEPISSYEMKLLANMTKDVCKVVAYDGGGMLGALMLEAPTYIDVTWESLPEDIKDVARSLGFDEISWMMDTSTSTSLQKQWEDLTDDELAAAEKIGYNRIEWYRE